MGREAPSEPGNKRQIFTTTWFWKSSDWHGGRRGESAELAGVMPASALKARLKGPSELKPALSAMVRIATSAWAGSASAVLASAIP